MEYDTQKNARHEYTLAVKRVAYDKDYHLSAVRDFTFSQSAGLQFHP